MEGWASSGTGCSEVNRRGQAFLTGVGAGVGGLIGCNIHGLHRRVIGEGGRGRRGEGAGGAVPIPFSVVFTTVGTAGGGGHTTVKDRTEVNLFGAGGIRALLLRLWVTA